MDYEFKFQFKIYQKHFKQPLRTSHGVWQVREGIIITLTDSAGIIGRGEIAPLPWFGSETLAQALAFCRQQKETIDRQSIYAIPDRLPCCQFALESAYLALTQPFKSDRSQSNFCYLLPAGKKALSAWKDFDRENAVSTFKWKIGVLPLTEEVEILQQLNHDLPSKVKLRLDANGGLTPSQAEQLLLVTDNLSGIEFIEQPLPPENFIQMLQLSQEHSTKLALDESVASFKQLKYVHARGWQGIYVIKAAIAGFSSRLVKFCQDNNLDLVFSSVLETSVARQAVLNLSQKLNHPRALGFGVQHLYH